MAEEGRKATARERTRQADEAAQVHRLGDQFLASLHHEIRTPISGIMGMTDLLLETELTEEQREYVDTTRLCAEQLMEMLNSALDYAELAAGNVRLEKSEIHLARILERTVNEFASKAEAKGLRLVCQARENVPACVIGDAVRLRQALSPLVANAIKFTSRGEVVVTAEMSKDGDAGARLLVSVKDTGVGIPKDRLRAIFDSFRQLESGLSRKYNGIGLGLALARKLAALMGGAITVDSEPGVGSTFCLMLPVEVPPEKDSASANALSQEASRRRRILLVDDNDVARRVVKHVLTRGGYDIDCAEGGADGIQAASQRRYDLILMDLQMPGINGLEATAAIRRLPGYAETPILALTANYSEEFKRSCREAGLQGFLSKPVQREDLILAIQQHLPPEESATGDD